MIGKKGSILTLLLVAALILGGTSSAQVGFDIEAPAGLLMEPDSGQILFAKNIDEKYPPASLVKIMTMLLVMEAVETGRAKLDDVIIISQRAESMGGSQVWLKAGERFTLEQLMESIAIASANDSTVAVAEYLAGNEETFVRSMNERARELGMNNTHFINTNGLPAEDGTEQAYTTARDMAILAGEAVRHPHILDWSKIGKKTFRKEPLLVMYNTNSLVSTYEGADGLKTGHTEAAGFHLVATARRDNLRLVSVVMRTESKDARESQSARLLDYGFRAFQMLKVLRNGDEVGEIRVPNGVPEVIKVKASRDLEVLLEKGRERNVTTEVVANENISAPLSPGDEVGEVIVKMEGKELGRAPVETPVRVDKAGFFARIIRWLRDLFSSLFTKK